MSEQTKSTNNKKRKVSNVAIDSNHHVFLPPESKHKPGDDPLVFPDTCNGIIERRGSVVDSNMQTLINTVNCVGVMGKGVALAFKQKYPRMFHDYQNRCRQKQVHPGEPYMYQSTATHGKYPKIVNFPTKNHWRNPSRLEWIEQGLIHLCKHIHEWGITSVAVPALGCGNGGLDWADVRPLVHKHLGHIGIPVELYVP